VHLVQLGVHVGIHVLTVHVQRRGGTGGAAQSSVQHGAVLGDVDVSAGEHRLDPAGQAHLVRELQEELDCAVGDEVLRQVDVQVTGPEGEPLRPVGVLGEPGAQVGGEGVLVGVQAGAGAGAGGVDRCGDHFSSSG